MSFCLKISILISLNIIVKEIEGHSDYLGLVT